MRDKFLDGGAYCRTVRQTGNATTTDSEVSGAYVSRFETDADGVATKGIANSAKLVVNYTATLAEDETLTLAGNFQDATSDAGAGVDDYGGAAAATVIAVGPYGGGTVTGTAEIDVDLAGAREFIRAQYTLATSSTGTTAHSSNLVLFGDHRQPSTKAIATLGGATGI